MNILSDSIACIPFSPLPISILLESWSAGWLRPFVDYFFFFSCFSPATFLFVQTLRWNFCNFAAYYKFLKENCIFSEIDRLGASFIFFDFALHENSGKLSKNFVIRKYLYTMVSCSQLRERKTINSLWSSTQKQQQQQHSLEMAWNSLITTKPSKCMAEVMQLFQPLFIHLSLCALDSLRSLANIVIR